MFQINRAMVFPVKDHTKGIRPVVANGEISFNLIPNPDRDPVPARQKRQRGKRDFEARLVQSKRPGYTLAVDATIPIKPDP